VQGPFDARALLAVAEAMIGVERSWEEDKIFACRARAVSSCVACSAGAALCLSWLGGNGQSEE